MNVCELTRALVDIESVTDNESRVGSFLLDYLSKLSSSTGGKVERMDVERDRFNVFASWGNPAVTLSTHLDTVPPFIPSREDSEHIWGRGSCDAKGIVASMIAAAKRLRTTRTTNFGLLFLVGEERNSAGASVAARNPKGSRFLINGEPTENKIALASKGTLRLELVARGVMAHSAYPELGESAIDNLLDALGAIRRIPLPSDELLGQCTLNIGTISGGCAPNVVADSAHAEVMIRLVTDADTVARTIASVTNERVEIKEVLRNPVVHFERFDGIPTTVVSFTTDVPVLGPAWGKPFLVGPGTIHVAHTSEERVPKTQLEEAVEIYADMVRTLLTK